MANAPTAAPAAAKAIALLLANLSKSFPSFAISFCACLEPLAEYWVIILAITAPTAISTPTVQISL